MGLTELHDLAQHVDTEPIATLALELLHIWAPPGHEASVAERLAAAFRESAGLDEVVIDEEFAGSPSVLAWIRGTRPGPTVQWHGHMDAIDVPHSPARCEGDTLIGRGAADMRAACAAMVEAARLLRAAGLPQRGNVLITLHGLHESGGNEPLHRLIERGIHGDVAIIGEIGGGQTLPVASMGLTFWEVTVHGPVGSVHETNAPPGTVQPLAIGHLLLDRLDALNAQLAERVHAYLGPESVYVGKFVCGDYYNRVPETCVLAGTRRHGPGIRLSSVRDELEALVDDVRQITGAAISTTWNGLAEAVLLDVQHPIVAAIQKTNRILTGHDLEFVGSRAAGNAVHFQEEAGIPAIYYGPDYSSAHSGHEVISVRDLGRIAAGFALCSALYLEEFSVPATP